MALKMAIYIPITLEVVAEAVMAVAEAVPQLVQVKAEGATAQCFFAIGFGTRSNNFVFAPFLFEKKDYLCRK